MKKILLLSILFLLVMMFANTAFAQGWQGPYQGPCPAGEVMNPFNGQCISVYAAQHLQSPWNSYNLDYEGQLEYFLWYCSNTNQCSSDAIAGAQQMLACLRGNANACPGGSPFEP
jgi:hypothetical protein